MTTSERMKMAAGEWYTCIDNELEDLRVAARDAVFEHNCLPPCGLLVMFGTIDLHIGAKQRPPADAHRRGIKDGAAGIEEGAAAEMDVETVGAVERCLDAGALVCAAEQR